MRSKNTLSASEMMRFLFIINNIILYYKNRLKLFIIEKDIDMTNYQKYGIKYPFTSNNEDNVFLDVNDSYMDSIKSQVLHVIFTPKGQKLRDPDFGTDLIKFIFNDDSDDMLSQIKSEITTQIKKYVPNVEFRDVTIYKDENNNNSIIVMIEYGVKNGNKTEITTVGVKL